MLYIHKMVTAAGETDGSGSCKDTPEDIKQSAFLEASNKCAIPACQRADVEAHLITPLPEGGKMEPGNVISLCSACHKRAHEPGGMDRMSISLHKARLKQNSGRLSQSEVDDLFNSFRRK